MPDEIAQAIAAIRHGGVIAHATEGVWGFACDPFCEAAVQRILAIKSRDVSKGLLLIGADVQAFAPELAACAHRQRIEERWPGPHTWVLPNQRFASWITGAHDGVACRVPGHSQARALCAAFGGALVSTSANRGGQPPAETEQQVQQAFADEVDVILSGQVCAPGQASTIYDADGQVIRE